MERGGGPPTSTPTLYMLLSLFKAVCVKVFKLHYSCMGIIIEIAEITRSSEDINAFPESRRFDHIQDFENLHSSIGRFSVSF